MSRVDDIEISGNERDPLAGTGLPTNIGTQDSDSVVSATKGRLVNRRHAHIRPQFPRIGDVFRPGGGPANPADAYRSLDHCEYPRQVFLVMVLPPLWMLAWRYDR